MTSNLDAFTDILIPTGSSAGLAPETAVGQRLGDLSLQTLILFSMYVHPSLGDMRYLPEAAYINIEEEGYI